MTNYQKAEVDESVLARVTEADVAAWIVARLDQLRKEGTPAHALSVQVMFSGDEFSFSWNAHALGHCAVSLGSTTDAASELRGYLLNNPERQAADKRAEARRLLEEAAALDVLIGSPSGPPKGGTPNKYPEHKPSHDEMQERRPA